MMKEIQKIKTFEISQLKGQPYQNAYDYINTETPLKMMIQKIKTYSLMELKREAFRKAFDYIAYKTKKRMRHRFSKIAMKTRFDKRGNPIN